MKVSDLCQTLNINAPFECAEDWDNVGLICGDYDDLVNGIVVSINLGPEALEAAKRKKSNVIICHHPPIFKPIKSVTKSKNPYLYQAIKLGINVITLHTNFDLTSKSLNQRLSQKLGFEWSDYLAPRQNPLTLSSNRLAKFVTYVPLEHLEKVRTALWKSGAGNIGKYTNCSFSVQGEGTFRGGPNSNPTVGTKGRLERVKEHRLELVFPLNKLNSVISAVKKSHPYEEVAYDVIELTSQPNTLGYGFVGSVNKKYTNLVFHKLVKSVKKSFQLDTVTIVGSKLGDIEMPVQRIAFSPGSGSSFVANAAHKNVDVYVCGEVGYHQMLEARSKGLKLILLGHSNSERFFVETVFDWCSVLVKAEMVFENIHEMA